MTVNIYQETTIININGNFDTNSADLDKAKSSQPCYVWLALFGIILTWMVISVWIAVPYSPEFWNNIFSTLLMMLEHLAMRK